MPLRILDHPLAAHQVTCLRDQNTPPELFRRATRTLSLLLALEATRDLRMLATRVTTPVAPADGALIDEGITAVPILRAGLGMLEPMLELFPNVDVGYIGLERHEETAIANSYYCKLPSLENKLVVCLDPMLATGGSASMAISLIKARNPRRVVMTCIVAAPEGIRRLEQDHPEVPIITASVDQGLDARRYIVPGVGDFGDRLFGT